MFSHLSGSGKVNVQLIQEAAVKELVDILDRCEGTKVINCLYIILIDNYFLYVAGYNMG